MMKGYRRSALKRELRAEGATAAEAGELVHLADNLRLLRRHDSMAVEGRFRHGIRLLAIPSAVLAAGVLIGAFVVAFAQMASPSSWLFPVQRASDSVAILLHPQYREVVMMKRADQVRELVASRASNSSQIGVLADYMEVANEYKDQPHANYAAFRYCKSQLSQAAQTATPQVKEAIQHSLYSLDTT